MPILGCLDVATSGSHVLASDDVSDLVGGIGVTNIILVSVTEWIREVGLRTAIGASPQVIRRQFLVEAALLGLAGGLLGIVDALVLPHLVSSTLTVSPTATVGATVVAICIGMAFGVHPGQQGGPPCPDRRSAERLNQHWSPRCPLVP